MAEYADYGLTSAPDGCRLCVQVAPRAAANRLLGPYRGALKVALTAPPVEGAANAALIAYLAEVLGVPRSRITLISGAASRAKLLHIAGLAPDAALTRLNRLLPDPA
jgi:uncharacterized protein (TIGR00251 family)